MRDRDTLKRNLARINKDARLALNEQQTDSESRVGLIKKEFAEHPSRGLTPARLHVLLEAAERGDIKAQHELFLDMEEKDPQISSDLGKRRQGAAELEWQIVPPDNATTEEKKATDFCNEVFRSIEVEDLIIDLGTGIGHGWQNLELAWDISEGHRIIKQPTARPHSWFQLHPDDQEKLTLRDSSYTGAELWPFGWVQHRHRAKAGYIARSGLHRILAWPYLFQNYALGDLAELLEIYGIPARIGKYPRNATDKEKSTLLKAVTSLGHRAAGIIPEGMSIDFMNAADGKSDMFKVMLDWCEAAKAKAILGGTLTSGTGEGTNTNALGNVHERGYASLIRSDARQYSGTIRRDIILPMVLLNFGIDDINRTPRFYLDTTETEDIKTMADALPNLVDMGMEIPTWWAHEKTGIPKPQQGDTILQSVNKTSTAINTNTPLREQISGVAALKTQPSEQAPGKESTAELSNQIQEATVDHLRTWIDAIRQMTEHAESLEALRDQLLSSYGDLPSEQLQQVMALGFSVAQAQGVNDVATEAGQLDG
jgi:phage gp29-like protein